MPDETVTLTRLHILAGASPRNGFTREQLATLGVTWPPPKGWMSALLGETIPLIDYQAFLNLPRSKDTL